MQLARRILCGRHTHHDDGSQIRRPRLYEAGVTVGLLGFRRRVFDGLVVLSGAAPGERVLDVGCGTGYLTKRMARAVTPGGALVGIDPSEPMVAFATRTAPPVCSFHVAGAEAIPEPDGSFDLVVSSLAVHHIPAHLRPAAFREMHRVLRPGGRLLIADLRPAGSRLSAAFSAHKVADDTVERVTALATDAGFRITGAGTRRPRLYYLQGQRV